MKWSAAAFAVALAGCAAASEPPTSVVPDVPRELTYCQALPASPPVLPPVVTTDRLAAGFHDLELARQSERARGADCAGKLQRLNDWIRDFLRSFPHAV
jgi:hypothetical protein